MKHSFLIITFLLLSSLLSFSQNTIKNATAFFNVLIDCNSIEEMTKICNQRGLHCDSIADGNHYYNFQDGTQISFKMDSISPKICFPIIKTTTPESKKKIETLLHSLQFFKKGKNKYIKGSKYTPTKQICIFSENKKNKATIFTISRTLNN